MKRITTVHLLTFSEIATLNVRDNGLVQDRCCRRQTKESGDVGVVCENAAQCVPYDLAIVPVDLLKNYQVPRLEAVSTTQYMHGTNIVALVLIQLLDPDRHGELSPRVGNDSRHPAMRITGLNKTAFAHSLSRSRAERAIVLDKHVTDSRALVLRPLKHVDQLLAHDVFGLPWQ